MALGSFRSSPTTAFVFVFLLMLIALPGKAEAFGAGNIASISTVEGKNWRHGDIEDTIQALAFIHGHKWTSAMIKRVYFGNWLRDYSQAMDVGTLKNLQADTIRVLVWILSFMTFGYATGEFEVTADRLGVYRPEEHIDNPKDYADNQDARQYDKRLRPPVRQIELDIDPETGMKNYIANERGDWATSAAYIKYSISRCIHYGRLYTSGGQSKGKEEDLFEALRCLGQGLHTLEDFGAHSNYCELVLREMGFHNVFPHVGAATEIHLRGKRVFPLVTGTFGMVDFFHSVLGEANDHFTQSELNEADNTLLGAESNQQSPAINTLTSLLGKIPGTKELVDEAEELQQRSNRQAEANRNRHVNTGYATSRGVDDYPIPSYDQTRVPADHYQSSHYGQSRGPAGGYGSNEYDQSRGPSDFQSNQQTSKVSGLPDIDPQKTVEQIYPILEFRDKVVRRISSIVEKIPGLEKLIDKITETVTLFVFSLLAPFIRPLINVASKSLQTGSMGVIESSGQHQYEVWDNPHCTDPTHSMLSKDHFANMLNEPAGQVAAAILRYVVPRVLYAWQHIDVNVDQVTHDCLQVFHHPACRDMHNEAHTAMFKAVESWVQSRPDRGHNLNDLLSAQSVRAGKNLTKNSSSTGGGHGHSHGGGGFPAVSGGLYGAGAASSHGQQQQSSSSSSVPWEQLQKLNIPGVSEVTNVANKLGGFGKLLSGAGLTRDAPEETLQPSHSSGYVQQQQSSYNYEQPPQHQQYQHQQNQYSQYQPQYSAPPPASIGNERYELYGQGGGYYQPPESGAYGHDQGYREHREHREHEHRRDQDNDHHQHEHGHGQGHGHSHSHHHNY
ncbi:HET-C domain protein HetC [Talaromyces stipitatus ATCC 10500]|uniref:HET-C domain protein HetC n=1 Tax=Talaromyces stipitatus (strain ATCC 10500 / CBS 375.48 / QM 6759 / NRRL 1006) TaxID=441959 RepID=B8MBP5_TALSN|nr:HET-C domain protein HetC [Talaromyces stipitatus ATCC 10500]EED18178.1 HET-C domain protein HetC [Talaromyces stipitatus ATCC 10500]